MNKAVELRWTKAASSREPRPSWSSRIVAHRRAIHLDLPEASYEAQRRRVRALVAAKD